MANEIKLKSSVVPGKVPLTTDLGLGIVAINNEDGKLYIGKTTSGVVTSVVEIGAGGGGGTTYTAGTGIDITGDVISSTVTGSIDQANVAITGGSISGLVSINVIGDLKCSAEPPDSVDQFWEPITIGRGSNGGTGRDTRSIAIGQGCLAQNTPTTNNQWEGTGHIAIGAGVLASNTTGQFNLGIGANALWQNTTGGANVGIGMTALFNCTTGSSNLAIGAGALSGVTTGFGNLGIGPGAGGVDYLPNTTLLTTGSNNILIGTNVIPSSSNAQNTIQIGSGTVGKGDNTILIGTSMHTATYLYGTLYVNDTPFTGSGGGGTPVSGPNVTMDFGSFVTPSLSIDFGAFA